MSNFKIERRETGEVVYAYTADQATEWPEYPFASFNHILQIEPVLPPEERNISGVQYLRRFTQAERIAIRAAASQSAELDDYLKLLDATIAQGGIVNLDDEDLITAAQMLELVGLIAPGRAAEVLA